MSKADVSGDVELDATQASAERAAHCADSRPGPGDFVDEHVGEAPNVASMASGAH